jgi:hypothetical protein
MAKKKKRPLKETLIIVGEGPTEVAFIKHLRSLYGTGNLQVTAKSAGGKGPSNVIGDAIGTFENSGADRVAALLDTDLAWPQAKIKAAQQKKITLIGATPCIEGLLLEILNQPMPRPCNNFTCKKAMHPQLKGRETDKNSYQQLFTKHLLDEAKSRVNVLNNLIKLIIGELR